MQLPTRRIELGVDRRSNVQGVDVPLLFDHFPSDLPHGLQPQPSWRRHCDGGSALCDGGSALAGAEYRGADVGQCVFERGGVGAEGGGGAYAEVFRGSLWVTHIRQLFPAIAYNERAYYSLGEGLVHGLMSRQLSFLLLKCVFLWVKIIVTSSKLHIRLIPFIEKTKQKPIANATPPPLLLTTNKPISCTSC